jgi:pyruvate-formate lyase-activating enzyme
MSGKGLRDLCVMACAFCRNPDFLAYLQAIDPMSANWSEAGAKQFVLNICGVASRSELDHDQVAARRFHELVRGPFLAWKAERS